MQVVNKHGVAACRERTVFAPNIRIQRSGAVYRTKAMANNSFALPKSKYSSVTMTASGQTEARYGPGKVARLEKLKNGGMQFKSYNYGDFGTHKYESIKR